MKFIFGIRHKTSRGAVLNPSHILDNY